MSAHSFPEFSSPCRYCGALASEVEPGTCTGKPQPPRSISRARVDQTPRTDAILLDPKTRRTIVVHGETFEALEMLARTLERELTAAQAALEGARKDGWTDQHRLHDDITDVVIKWLHYCENNERISQLTTAEEVTESMAAGIKRFGSDPIFRAKVNMLVARLMGVIDAARAKGDRNG